MATASLDKVRAHWAALLESLEASPKDFYTSVQKAIEKRDVPDATPWEIKLPEGGRFSARRLYLRVQRREYTIDVCGAPFGTGFFVSEWLILPGPSILVGIILVLLGIIVLLWSLQFPIGSSIIRGGQILYLPVVQGAAALEIVLAVLFGIIRPLFFPPRMTYYRYDTAEMFFRAVHEAVKEVLDGLCTAQGVRLLSEEERKPIMRGLN